MRANLWLRTASRVLVRVAAFRATRFHELERAAKRIDWTPFLGTAATPDFRVTARKSRLYHSDAIAQRLAEAAGANPAGQHAQLFVVRVVHDDFEISVDSSGDLLHMRGYRQATAKAPLRETLAAALLLAAGWSGQMPLLDPFCGSGTIPIEGALIGRRMAPGLQRDFAFTRWPAFDARLWTTLRNDAREVVRAGMTVAIHGSDRDVGALEASIANAERAGVANDVQWSRRAVSAVQRTSESGLVASNPPYGKRVRGGQDVRNVYAQLGNVARNTLPGWRVALYTSESRLASQIRLPLKQEFQTVNGGIRVTAWIGDVPRE